MAAPQSIRSLVTRYDRQRNQPRSEPAARGQLHAKYVHKLLAALAWDTTHTYESAGSGGQVVREHALARVAVDEKRPPQYSLRVSGVRKCFVGIAPDKARLSEDPMPAFHLRRFAWSANLPLSVLGNFEELCVYDGRIRPLSSDQPDVGRVLRFQYTEYEERWDDIAGLLSKSAVERGELDRFVTKRPADSLLVDDAFLNEIDGWRRSLAQSIDAHNPWLSLGELNSAVQLTIDRIIFLRICEDRGIEPYGQLRALQDGGTVYRRLLDLFMRADARYNAGLFRIEMETIHGARGDSIAPRLSIDDEVLRAIFRNLYAPESPYEFSVISADILGQVYERFLGQVITRSSEQGVNIEEKPEVRKSGGVYYTPSRVVEHIVRSTVGRLCEGKTPEEVASMRILDPSCGSGSFLTAAYQYLLDWHRDFYVSDGVVNHRDRVRRIPHGGFRLSLEERSRIVLNNIYGVDIDAQAVEITKLSLLLKVLEGEGTERNQLVLLRDRVLPDLANNIQCGNSLVGLDFEQRAAILTEEQRHKINAFDYANRFPDIFGSEHPGFDAIIGNPPYLSFSGPHSVEIPDAMRAYLKDTFSSFRWPSTHALFIERSVVFLSRRYVAFIVPDQVAHLQGYRPLRELVQEHAGLVDVHYWGENVFKGVLTPALTFLVDKDFNGPTKIVEEDGDIRFGTISGGANWNISALPTLLEKVRVRSFSIRPFIKDCGIMTNRSKEQVIPITDSSEDDIPVLEGTSIQRYTCAPPTHAVHKDPSLRIRRSEETYRDAAFLIRQTAAYPIVGPHEHALHFRNSLLALYAPSPWPDVRYIVGILNSRLMRVIYTETIREAGQKTFPQVKIGSLGSLPLRELDPDNPAERAFHDEIVRSVEEILALRRALREASDAEQDAVKRRIGIVDDRLDRLVYRLYGLSKDEVTLVNQALGHAVDSNAQPPASAKLPRSAEEMTSGELWGRVENSPKDEGWQACLDELVERENPDVPAYIASQMQIGELQPSVRSALVFAAERSQCFEPDVRAALKEGLLAQAIALRDAGEERPLWSAVRRFASLVPVEEVDALLSFLRDEDQPTTLQVALQGIQHIFSVDLPRRYAAVERVRERVHHLATKFISPAYLAPHSGGASLALQLFCAAAALLDAQLSSLGERLLQLHRPYLVSRATEFLHTLELAWARAHEVEPRAEAQRLLSESIAKLSPSEPEHRASGHNNEGRGEHRS